jgi:hypothetical protein
MILIGIIGIILFVSSLTLMLYSAYYYSVKFEIKPFEYSTLLLFISILIMMISVITDLITLIIVSSSIIGIIILWALECTKNILDSNVERTKNER